MIKIPIFMVLCRHNQVFKKTIKKLNTKKRVKLENNKREKKSKNGYENLFVAKKKKKKCPLGIRRSFRFK